MKLRRAGSCVRMLYSIVVASGDVSGPRPASVTFSPFKCRNLLKQRRQQQPCNTVVLMLALLEACTQVLWCICRHMMGLTLAQSAPSHG